MKVRGLIMTFTTDNPVFVTYMITAAIMVIKIMAQGWMTVYRMLKSDEGLASPEDLRPGLINKNPRPEQLEISDYVDRSRRMHRNDLENIPAFLACGLIFVAAAPALLGQYFNVWICCRPSYSCSGLCDQTKPRSSGDVLYDWLGGCGGDGGVCSGCHGRKNLVRPSA